MEAILPLAEQSRLRAFLLAHLLRFRPFPSSVFARCSERRRAFVCPPPLPTHAPFVVGIGVVFCVVFWSGRERDQRAFVCLIASACWMVSCDKR